jgi:hypothetical protein
MKFRSREVWCAALFLAVAPIAATIVLCTTRIFAQTPPPAGLASEVSTTIFHAEGAQIYQCESEPQGLEWQARESIAILIRDGKTVGRQYTGAFSERGGGSSLRWEHVDGSSVEARVVANGPGTTMLDVPWLKFTVIAHNGNGALGAVMAVGRINTRGGTARGSCNGPGKFLSVPFSAEYVFVLEH